MSIGPSRWHQRRRAAQAARQRPMVDACQVRPRALAAGYEATLTGMNLTAPGIPTEVRIGDQMLKAARITSHGRITGILRERPHDEDEAVVSVGGEQARARVSMVAAPAFPRRGEIRRVMMTWWEALHRRWMRGRRGDAGRGW